MQLSANLWTSLEVLLFQDEGGLDGKVPMTPQMQVCSNQHNYTFILLVLVSSILSLQHQQHSYPHCEIAGGKNDKP